MHTRHRTASPPPAGAISTVEPVLIAGTALIGKTALIAGAERYSLTAPAGRPIGRGIRAIRAVLIALAASTAPLSAATLEVSFTGLANDRGQALFALFADADGFPARAESAVARLAGPVINGHTQVVFENVAPGNYALSALHDSNGSGSIDLNLFGIPKEKFGVSNVAEGRPTWEEALFRVAADESVVIIELRPLRFF